MNLGTERCRSLVIMLHHLCSQVIEGCEPWCMIGVQVGTRVQETSHWQRWISCVWHCVAWWDKERGKVGISYRRLLNVRARGSVSKMRKCEQTRMISSGTMVESQPREALDVVLYKMYVLKPFNSLINSLYASRRAKFPSTCPIHDSFRSASAKSLQLLDNEI